MACLLLCESFSFLVTNNQNFMAINLRKPSEHGWVVTKSLVTVKFNKFIKNKAQVITCFWSVRMSSNFNSLPWIEIAKNLFLEIGTFPAKLLNLILRLLAERCCLEVGNFILEFVNWFLEGQTMKSASH